MFPELTLMQCFFWSAWAECMFYSITDFLRSECPRCAKKSGKCRSKHYKKEHYQDSLMLFRAWKSVEISHVLQHFEEHWAIYNKQKYSPNLQVAVGYYLFHPDFFTWDYIYNHKEILDYFIDLEIRDIEADHESILNWVNTFALPGDIHSMLDYICHMIKVPQIQINLPQVTNT